MTLRLLADDLTGALDTAAELVPLVGPVPVVWAGTLPAAIPASAAIDSGTREQARADATRTAADLAPQLAEADVAYKKVDSLLRGHTMAELAACWRLGRWDRCVVAPAFPFQGRVTVGGTQRRQDRSGQAAIVADVVALLAEAGIEARPGDLSEPLPPGVTVFDASTDDDLAAVAALGRAAAGRVLWCGSAGLAQALAGRRPQPAAPSLSGRVLGLFGSDQDVTARQLAACGGAWLRLSGRLDDVSRLRARLDRDRTVMASAAMPDGLSRAEAARRIGEVFTGIVRAVAPPDALLVAGGETLRWVCGALGTASLEVRGQFEPGLPHSIMRGGLWDGVTVVSKSGAFGGPGLWRDLLAAHGHDIQTDRTKAEKVEA